jgi:hypothetical protein
VTERRAGDGPAFLRVEARQQPGSRRKPSRVTLRTFILLFAVAFLLDGCAPALRIKKIDSAEEKPANVLLFFKVTAKDAPVPSLQESAFTVKEDERVIGPGVDRVIVNPDLRSSQTTLVLVDLGGRPSAEELDAMSSALGAVVDRLGGGRRTAIFALDGAEQPATLAPFGVSNEALKAAVAHIPTYKPRDPSLDLNGGYVAALRALRAATPPSNGPRIANLVLIARGTDRASRVDLKAVAAELQHTEIDIGRYAIAFAPDADKMKLAPFADGSFFLAPNADALKDAASRIAESIDTRGRSFYLLSYCTASRGGLHKLTLDVARERETKKGHVEVDHGSLGYTFRADGFGPGCTPNVPEGWKSEPGVVRSARLDRGGAKPSLAGAVSAPR